MFPKETKILIADDMVGMRKLVKSTLLQLGFRNVTDEENGEKALATLTAALNTEEPFQLVISDWNMPRMTGIDFLRAVRQNPKTVALPFVLLTAENETHQILEAIKLRVSEYLIKPFTPQSLQKKLEVVWNKINKK